ncbi:MAG: hypothetical protein OJF47_003812 [Nitrospira sp.]|nr:MAG: hypothetical protein OJF47_003812 [Nitrospira sp.]
MTLSAGSPEVTGVMYGPQPFMMQVTGVFCDNHHRGWGVCFDRLVTFVKK